MANGDSPRIATGQLSFDGGVDSSRTTTIASPNNPNGLPQNALAWANNCTMRGSGILQRTGWFKVCKIADSTGLYQGGWMYTQLTSIPYLIVAISGRFYRIRVDTDNSIDDITGPVVFPPTEPLYHFVQGEEFMVVQAGDYVTLPAFWDGNTMRQSNGITGVVGPQPAGEFSLNFTNWATIAAVGNTFNAPVQAFTGAAPNIGDQGTLGNNGVLGTFEVIDNTPATFQLKTIASNFVGQKLAPYTIEPNYPFTVAAGPAPTNINELPAAGPMVYYQGRIWYAYFRSYTAGDIVKGPSGTAAYQQRDSILKVTENPLAVGGDGFSVPTQAGNIRALQYVTNPDKQLGEGTLFVFTRQQVYALDVPITRTDWIAASSNSPPLQRVVQRNNGGVSDRSIVAVNGDLFYQSLDPAIRSLFTALRFFNQWSNGPISNNIERALAFNNRALMVYSTGVEYQNRLYQAILPEQRPQGVVHRGIAVLDFEPLSTLGQKLPPNWEGLYEGLDILQLFKGDFGGRERTFAVVVSKEDSSIELWEFSDSLRFDNVDTRVQWYVEFPAYTWSREFDMKKLDGGELWVDKLFGTVDGKVFYRNDANPCWQLWTTFKLCTARSTCEDVNNPVCYPAEVLRESGKIPIQFPVPPLAPCDPINRRPTNIGFQFQVRIEISGWMRIRGLLLYAVPHLKTPFGSMECAPGPFPPLT